MSYKLSGIRFIPILFLILTAPSGIFSAQAQNNWVWRNRLPQGNCINHIEFADGRFVAAGDCGTILSSSDGKSWRHHPLPTTKNMYDVAFGNETWVAVGEAGTIVTSADGTTWRGQPLQGTYSNNVICFGNGIFVTAGGFGTICTSSDGTTWQQVQESGPVLYDMVYTGVLFVGVGGDGAVLTSSDGASWTKKSAGTGEHLTSLLYNGSEFIVAGSTGVIRSSSDGNVWSAYRDGTRSGDLLYNTWLDIGSDSQRVVVVGWSGLSVVFNTDGSTVFPRKLRDTELRCVASGNGALVGGGSSGDLWLLRDSVWTSATQDGPTLPVRGIAYGNGCFAAISDYDHFFHSENGDTWSDTAIWDLRLLSSIVFGNGKFVAVGDEKILRSSDGIAWTIGNSPTLGYMQSISWGNDRFVIVARYDPDYQVLSSTDERSWTKTLFTTNKRYNTVSFCNDRFLLCGDEGDIRSSLDGVNWQSLRTGSSQTLYSAAWGNGLYVAVGRHGTILTSPDAAAWQDRTLPEEWREFYVVQWCGDRFVAAGYYGLLATSADGVSWSLDSCITISNLYAVAFNEKRIIVSGDKGAIISLDRELQPAGAAPQLPGAVTRSAWTKHFSCFDLSGRAQNRNSGNSTGNVARAVIVRRSDGTMRKRVDF